MLNDATKDLTSQIATAMRDDYLSNPHLVNVFSTMNPAEVRKFILEDLKDSFSGSGYQPTVFKNLATQLDMIARENRPVVQEGVGQFDIAGALSAAVNIATSAGSVYLQKKATEDAKRLAEKSQELQAMQAKAAQAAAMAQALQAKKEADVIAAQQTKPMEMPLGVKPWMLAAGVGLAAIVGFMVWRNR